MATCVMRARCLTGASAMFTLPTVHLGRGSAPWSPCAASTSSHSHNAQTRRVQQHGHLVASSWLLGRSRTVRCMASSTEEAETVQVEISIPDMMCGGCTSRVEKALLAMDKVKKVDVSLETKIATVEVEAPTQFDALAVLSKLVDGVSALGFAAAPHIE